jgi:hypothetical protein
MPAEKKKIASIAPYLLFFSFLLRSIAVVEDVASK